MTIDGRRVYFNAVLGGLGGLAGWFLTEIFVGSGMTNVPILSTVAQWLAMLTENTDEVRGQYVQVAVQGLIDGGCIGVAIGSTDGLVLNRSLNRMLRGMGFGLLMGALGGLVGLLLGAFIFQLAGGGIWLRSLGWAVFGMMVGSSDGFAQRMPAKVRYGVFGGLLGGLLGGSTLERILQIQGPEQYKALQQSGGTAIGLIILGACIGALTGLVESLLRRAWLTFLSGREESQNRTLDPSQARTVLGSSERCGIVLPGDPAVSDVHAAITVDGEDFVLEPAGGPVKLLVGGHPSEIASRHVLRDGDQIEIGTTRLVFRSAEEHQP